MCIHSFYLEYTKKLQPPSHLNEAISIVRRTRLKTDIEVLRKITAAIHFQMLSFWHAVDDIFFLRALENARAGRNVSPW